MPVIFNRHFERRAFRASYYKQLADAAKAYAVYDGRRLLLLVDGLLAISRLDPNDIADEPETPIQIANDFLDRQRAMSVRDAS